MSFDSDEFDDISLPDISDIDLSIYDKPTISTQAARAPPPPPPPPAPARQAPVSDDDDAQYWTELPIRVNSQGEYVVQNNVDEGQDVHRWDDPEPAPANSVEETGMNVDRAESSTMAAQRARQQARGGIAQAGFDRPSSLKQSQPRSDAQADAQTSRALEAAMAMKADLERQLKQFQEEALAAKGEASNLRRLMADKEEKAQAELAAATERHHAVLDKMKKKEQERQQLDEATAVKRALEGYTATGSVRRPTTFGPTQSVSRTHAKSHQQPQWSQVSASQQTPAPLSRTTRTTGVALGTTAMGGGFSQKFGGGGTMGSPMVMGSVNGKGKGKGKEVDRAHLPPVPKFPNLQNSFAPKRTTARPPPPEPALAPSTPTNPSRMAKSLSRSPSKSAPSVTSPLSKSPFGRLGSNSPRRTRDGQAVSDGSPSPSKKKRRVEELGGEEYADDGGLGMEVDFGGDNSGEHDGDRTIRLGDEQADDGSMHHGEDGAHGHAGDDEDEEEDFWTKDEKAILLSTIFNHLVDPLGSKPTRSSPSQSIQIVLAPLPASAEPTIKDLEDHARSCGRVMTALSGVGLGGNDPLNDVVKGLNGVAKVFQRLDLLLPLTATLKLLASVLVHIPRAATLLARLQSFPLLVGAIKDRVFPAPLPAPTTKKGLPVVEIDGAEVEGANEKARVVQAMVDVLEVVVWEAGDGQVDLLIHLVELPNLVSGLLLTSQPPRVVMQTVRILVYLSLHEALSRPLLSFPDIVDDRTYRDPARIPLIEALCRYLRTPHPLATPMETVVLSLDILSFFRTLIHKQQDEAILLLSQSRSFVPTLIVSLEHRSSLIWGVGVSAQVLRLSIPPLLSSLQLLSLLLTPSSNLVLTEKLHHAPRSDFNACWERFLVGFGRICYADIPDLKEIFWAEEREEAKGRRGEEEAEVWEKELVRAGEIALDIFDEVIEGPEGDLVYAIFATDTPEYAQPPHSQYQTQPISVLDDSDDSATEEEEGDDAGDGVRKSGRSSGKKAKKVQEVIEISDDDDD